MIKLALETAFEGADTVVGPAGEIGEGTGFDFLPSRILSRSSMAGGEVRLGAVAIYMRSLCHKNTSKKE